MALADNDLGEIWNAVTMTCWERRKSEREREGGRKRQSEVVVSAEMRYECFRFSSWLRLILWYGHKENRWDRNGKIIGVKESSERKAITR